MKKLLLLPVLFSSTLFAQESVEFTPENTVVFRGAVSNESTSELTQKILSSKQDNILMYIDSPGGSVFAAAAFMDVMKSSGKKISCVVSFAASAAFAITQHCDKRYILKSGIMMQHQMSYGLRHNSEKNQDSFIKLIKDYGDIFSEGDYTRIGIPKEDYESRIAHDWWLTSTQAVSENVVDSIVNATCSKSLIEQRDEQVIRTMFGDFKIIWSGCPLISFPLEISQGLLDNRYEIYNKVDAIKKFKNN